MCGEIKSFFILSGKSVGEKPDSCPFSEMLRKKDRCPGYV